jgi:hypothetical protein
MITMCNKCGGIKSTNEMVAGKLCDCPKEVECALCKSKPLIKYITVCLDCFNLVAIAKVKNARKESK